MAELTKTIFDFFLGLFNAFRDATYPSYLTAFTQFMDKEMISGELLAIGGTWKELLIYGMPLIVSLLLIFLVFKVLWKALFGKIWK